VINDSDDQEPTLAQTIEANVRNWNSYWAWKDKPVGERGAAQEILSSAGFEFANLISRPAGLDPPDCEATVEGQFAGIEVSELVHESTLARSLKAQRQRLSGLSPAKPEAYFLWDRDSLIQALQSRIDAKDGAKLIGGPYQRYILVLHTDEMFLPASNVEMWLADVAFRASRITDVLLGLSYDPHYQRCPVFSLRLDRLRVPT
jgi:hypothetical protein